VYHRPFAELIKNTPYKSHSARITFDHNCHPKPQLSRHQYTETRFNVLGCSTIKVVSQFDILETSISSLKEEMHVVGLNALRAFIEAKRARPFLYVVLKRVMEAAEIAEGIRRRDI